MPLKKLGCLLVSMCTLAACNTPDAVFDAPVLAERILFSADRQYPEGITYSASIDKFLISSLTQGKIGTVDQSGRYVDLIADNQMISSVGMKIYNGKLYVCHGDLGISTKSKPETALKTAGLFVYDLATGQNVKRVDLTKVRLLPNSDHYANDMAFDNQGNVYVTDSFAPVIYKVPADTTQPSLLVNVPFFANAPGFNLNGIVYHPDNYLIVVKSNDGKLFRIDLGDANQVKEITGVNLPNGDGMVLYNNDLYVVNGRNKVTQLRSTDGWSTASIVKTDSVGYDQATTNTVVNGKIYTLNARINEVNAAVMAKNPSLLTARDYSIQQFK